MPAARAAQPKRTSGPSWTGSRRWGTSWPTSAPPHHGFERGARIAQACVLRPALVGRPVTPRARGARRRKQRRARVGRSAGRTTGNHRALDRCLSGVTRPSRRGRPAHGVQALADCQQRRRAGKRLQMLAYGKPRIHAARSRGLGSLRVHASRRSENTILSGGRLLLPFRNLDPT